MKQGWYVKRKGDSAATAAVSGPHPKNVVWSVLADMPIWDGGRVPYRVDFWDNEWNEWIDYNLYRYPDRYNELGKRIPYTWE